MNISEKEFIRQVGSTVGRADMQTYRSHSDGDAYDSRNIPAISSFSSWIFGLDQEPLLNLNFLRDEI